MVSTRSTRGSTDYKAPKPDNEIPSKALQDSKVTEQNRKSDVKSGEKREKDVSDVTALSTSKSVW